MTVPRTRAEPSMHGSWCKDRIVISWTPASIPIVFAITLVYVVAEPVR
jgi:hypothetical protein